MKKSTLLNQAYNFVKKNKKLFAIAGGLAGAGLLGTYIYKKRQTNVKTHMRNGKLIRGHIRRLK